MVGIVFGASGIGTVYAAPPVAQVSVTRFAQNPLITLPDPLPLNIQFLRNNQENYK